MPEAAVLAAAAAVLASEVKQPAVLEKQEPEPIIEPERPQTPPVRVVQLPSAPATPPMSAMSPVVPQRDEFEIPAESPRPTRISIQRVIVTKSEEKRSSVIVDDDFDLEDDTEYPRVSMSSAKLRPLSVDSIESVVAVEDD
jgi:hypothetical protein